MPCGGGSRRWALCNREGGATATPDGAVVRASLPPQPAEKTKVVSAFVGARSAMKHWAAPSQRVGLRQMGDGHYPLRGLQCHREICEYGQRIRRRLSRRLMERDFMLDQTHRGVSSYSLLFNWCIAEPCELHMATNAAPRDGTDGVTLQEDARVIRDQSSLLVREPLRPGLWPAFGDKLIHM